jgi:hypothetical protein
MVSTRVIEVDGFLEQAQAQGLGIKIQILFGHSGKGRDMMQA